LSHNELKTAAGISPEETVSIRQFIDVVLRRLKIVLVCFFLIFSFFALYTFKAAPVYRLQSTLYAKQNKASISVLDDLGIGAPSPIEAEMQILKSRTNIEEVVRRLHLDWVVSKKSREVSVKVADYFIPHESEERTLTITLLGNGDFGVANKDATLGQGRVGVPFASGEIRLQLEKLEGPAGEKFEITHKSFSAVVREALNNITAAEVGKKTNVIEVSCMDTDPVRGMEIINTLVDVYLSRTIDFNTGEASQSLQFIEKQLAEVKKVLEGAEKDLENYRKKTGIVLLDDEGRKIVETLADLENRRAKISFSRRQLEISVASLKEAAVNGKSFFPAANFSDPLVAELSKRLSELELKKQFLLADSTEDHPMVRQIESQLVETRARLLSVNEEALSQTAREQNSIEDQIRTHENRLKDLPEVERTLAGLTRVMKVNSDMYMFLLEKHESARILKASTISNIRVIDQAIVPDLPVKPNKPRNLVLGLLLGLFFAVGVAFVVDHLDNAVKTADEATKIAGVAVLTQIPYMGVSRKREKKKGKNGKNREEGPIEALIGHHDPKSPITEAYRRLRTALRYSKIEKPFKRIMFTSSLPGEGKSTTSANFAVVLAQTGSRVILVECDLRKPVLETFFNLPRSPGLTELLAGEKTLEETVENTQISGLSLLPCGVIPPNPTELIGSDRMKEVLQKLEERFDFIVIDTPPVMPVSDAQVLGESVDRVVLVVSAGKTPAPALKHTMERLKETNAEVSGLVLGHLTKNRAGYYNYGYGYGAYDKYYGDKSGKHSEEK
jgi:tyrosine-protein kinase Etk/Wzc